MALISRFVVALFAVLATFSTVLAYEYDEGVLVLTEKNFDAAINEFGSLLVEFYAPWCGHCKRLAPEYAKAAEVLKGDNLHIAKVDATVEKELGSRFSIQGFPTLKFFTSPSNSVDYQGARDADAIVSFVRRKSGPALKAATTLAEVEALVAKNDVSYVLFASKGSSAESIVNSVASSSDDASFIVTDSDEARAHYGVKGEALVALNNFEGQDNKVVFTEPFSVDAVSQFASANSIPLVVAFTPESAPKIFRGPIKTHFLLFADPASDDYKSLVSEFRAVAASGKSTGKAILVTVDPTQDRILGFFGVSSADMPAAVIVTMPENEQMKKYKYPVGEAFKQANFAAFLDKFFAGSLKPFLKSEEAAPEDLSGPVAVVKGSTFEKIVLDSTKDVLIEFYAPWCGHCKQLAPEWEALGQKVAATGSKNVVIAKIDATANEVEYPGVNVRGFPTILFFPATTEGQKKVIEYDGSRDSAGFISFLEKHATNFNNNEQEL